MSWLVLSVPTIMTCTLCLCHIKVSIVATHMKFNGRYLRFLTVRYHYVYVFVVTCTFFVPTIMTCALQIFSNSLYTKNNIIKIMCFLNHWFCQSSLKKPQIVCGFFFSVFQNVYVDIMHFFLFQSFFLMSFLISLKVIFFAE